jgi:hypothetical protein
LNLFKGLRRKAVKKFRLQLTRLQVVLGASLGDGGPPRRPASRPALSCPFNMLNRLSLCASLQRSPDRAGLIRLRRDVIDLPRTITHNPEIHDKLFIIQIIKNWSS